MLFPNAGPDYKYMLGFVRTQLSTTTTIALVFGPKIARVFKGQGDKWDQKAKVRSITASFSLNGVGLVPEESPDLYQENEELKEQVQKLAHQIEFMKTVHMQMNNRHLKPKPGGYFTITSTSFQAPYTKSTVSTAQTQTGKDEFSCLSGNATPLKCKSPKGKHGKVVDDAIDFSFYQQAEEQQHQKDKYTDADADADEQMLLNDDDLLRQFRRLFAPIVDDSLQLYYQLNEELDDDVQHIRIHRTVAELLELTSSEEDTLVTQLNSPLPPMEPPMEPPATPTRSISSSMSSSTSSRCLYAIHTPVPGQRLESPLSASGSSEPHTITEQVQLHAPPLHIGNSNNNNGEEDDEPSCSHNNNNNTSCSLSSTLTDSKTLDARTPIVV
ncbi:hypothetical protein ACLKA6_019383 [Drosophila palustris]